LPNVWHNPIKTVGAVREQSSAGKSGRFPGADGVLTLGSKQEVGAVENAELLALPIHSTLSSPKLEGVHATAVFLLS
jgi:hypothetical protein